MPRRCPKCGRRTDLEVCPGCDVTTEVCGTLGSGARVAGSRKVDPLVGQIFQDRYRLEACIGAGGMGAVYRAVQLATNQVVAVKVLLHQGGQDPIAVKRFRREIAAASRLSHPHTVRIFDAGTSESGFQFLVLEYLDGLTLRQILDRKMRLGAQQVSKIVLETAQALAEAHQTGLMHRDLCPSNIMLIQAFGDPDFVKVLDLGIARSVTEIDSDSQLTPFGLVIGKPEYMAPECCTEGGISTPALDIYALGITAFEALTGRVPFDRPTPLATLMAHVSDPLPPFPDGVRIPPILRDLVTVMLSKEPGARPSASDVIRVLEPLVRLLRSEHEDVHEYEDPPDPTGPMFDYRKVEESDEAEPTLVLGAELAEAIRTQALNSLPQATVVLKPAPSVPARGLPEPVWSRWEALGAEIEPESRNYGELSTGLIRRIVKTPSGHRAYLGFVLVAVAVFASVVLFDRFRRGDRMASAANVAVIAAPDVTTQAIPEPLVQVEPEVPQAPDVAAAPVGCPEDMIPVSLSSTAPAFCIDPYEYPGRLKIPRAPVTWEMASRLCVGEGKKLCTRREWLSACGASLPYGAAYSEGSCNVSQGKLLPSGRFPDCRTRDGVLDLVGNAAEWVQENVLMGGDISGGRDANCHTEVKRFQPSPTSGFRCCAAPTS